jgi:hypothetical protein
MAENVYEVLNHSTGIQLLIIVTGLFRKFLNRRRRFNKLWLQLNWHMLINTLIITADERNCYHSQFVFLKNNSME